LSRREREGEIGREGELRSTKEGEVRIEQEVEGG
jgi:hypothetical protein